jgi:signal transduction histidine kinase
MHPEHPVNILLVDDRLENLLALEAILGPLGHNLVKAHSGTDALKCLLTQDFAVILLDVQMPGMDGFETAELIRGRARSQDTPIIFLTAVNTSEMHVFRGYALGAVDYLLKPIVPEILISKVSVFVDLFVKTEKIRRQAAELESTVRELEIQIAERKRSEQALRQARDELELRVQERTANLAATNEALRNEIGERKRAEEERAHMLIREQRARAEAEAAVKLRDQFLSIASHELKTPLTSLFGYVQLIQRRFERSGGAEHQNTRLLEVVVEQASRLNRLIEALLDISRIRTGQLTITRKPLDLNTLVCRVADEVKPVMDQHPLTCESIDEPLVVSGDELRLEQVLHNLIQNAIKYSPDGGTIIIKAERRDQHGAVSVVDEGIGIPPEALPNLFQRFYRADNADARNISGMGVGLYVVKEIIGMHGGTVEVTSIEGAGSTFTFLLPLHNDVSPYTVANVSSVVVQQP